MLQSTKELTNYVLSAEDGEIGRCKDFLIDDRPWVVRYMVADTGKWLPGRKVLLAPSSLGTPDWLSKYLPVQLSKAQIEQAPGLETDAPVSRQFEVEYHTFFGLPYYWSDPLVSEAISPSLPAPGRKEALPPDEHMRSTAEITGYNVQATDGDIGKVKDFILDESWMIRYLIIDIGNWISGREILLSPTWLGEVDWALGLIAVHMTREQMENSPAFNDSVAISREYEDMLYKYYKQPKYWV